LFKDVRLLAERFMFQRFYVACRGQHAQGAGAVCDAPSLFEQVERLWIRTVLSGKCDLLSARPVSGGRRPQCRDFSSSVNAFRLM
jgi:hypothetical protein